MCVCVCILRGKMLGFLKTYQDPYIYLCHLTWALYFIVIIIFKYLRLKPIKSI